MVALLETGARHAFTDSAFLNEIFLQPTDLLVEEVIRLVDEADSNVGEGFRRAVIEEVAVGFERLAGLTAEATNIEGFSRILFPNRFVANAQKGVPRGWHGRRWLA